MSGELLGQARAQKILDGFLTRGRVPQSLLFHGPAGVGKVLAAEKFAARLLGADALGAAHPDFIRVNAAYQACLRQEEESRQRSLRVDTVREARRAMETSPVMGERKVAIIEDADLMEIEASNALLKILEEPPPRAVWILTASRRARLPRTVLSRCAAVAFSPLDEADVLEILRRNGVDEEAALRAAKLCDGSAGLALELARADYPRALIGDPLAPLRSADDLGADLPQARSRAELALFALTQELRSAWRSGRASFRKAAPALGEIRELEDALRANVDPRAIVAWAGLRARRALA